jgi:hypothetical protein
VDSEDKLQFILPYMLEFLKDTVAKVKAKCVDCVIELLS